MTIFRYACASVLGAFLAFGVHGAQARDQIRIVGSSTVFPFSARVAEQFAKTTNFKAPVVEQQGSGGGLDIFCNGIGDRHPDITNSSRRIKLSEIELCRKNGVHDIIEVKIGYDGIILANSIEARVMALSVRDIYLALAKNIPTADGGTRPNPHQTWNDVNPDLAATRIEVLGPPPTSGTRDAFVELAMEAGCQSFAWVAALESTDNDSYRALCHTMREDGRFIMAGENDNFIVRKLVNNKTAFGIFGFSFLDQNYDKVQGSIVNGVEPTFENIAAQKYPISRPLYFYVKKAHIGVVPGIEEFLAEFTSLRASGPEGYLTDKGLIPLPDDERREWQDKVAHQAKLVM